MLYYHAQLYRIVVRLIICYVCIRRTNIVIEFFCQNRFVLYCEKNYILFNLY